MANGSKTYRFTSESVTEGHPDAAGLGDLRSEQVAA
jgi:S-adenosylmethionine synthetase